MMREIEKVTMSVEYVTYHLFEYVHDVQSLRDTVQEYLDKAWELVEENRATEEEALHIRDLAKCICMILDADNEIIF